MQVSFGSFIPTRVMLKEGTSTEKEITGTQAADDVMALLCTYLRNDKDSPDTPSVEKHKQCFVGYVPSYHYPDKIYSAKKTPEQNVTTMVVEDGENSDTKTKYILTGADARYLYDMGSLLKRRSEPWLYSKTEPFEEKEANQLRAKAAIERQKSLRAMVQEHAFPKTLIIHAEVLNPEGETKKEKYEIPSIEFAKNATPGLDFTA